ncbi:MAG: hypothetical protein PUD42_06390 [Clostridiales bacterium]|nr:hypothetical protein [Clostridiales bacterium]MDY2729437.1 hypothetical protein [Clostridium sp.]NLK23435.1 hypothetical protein [Clostridiales bacterium]
MKELFRVKDLIFYDEDHAKDYDDEYAEDLEYLESNIPILKELQNTLTYEKITCTEVNKCCNIGKENYIVELQGFLDENDEFITNEEVEKFNVDKSKLSLYIIRVYKCVDCGKWIIDVIDDGLSNLN